MPIRSGSLASFVCALAIAVIAFQQPATAAPAAAFGPEVKVGDAHNGYVGALDVVPEHGKEGSRFTVVASKLPPNQDFQLIWRTVNGRWNVDEPHFKGRDYVPVAYQMGKVKSDAQGRISASFVTPEDFGFQHDIVLQQGDRLLTQIGYSIDMTVDMSPKSGPVGTPITVTVKGIGWRTLVNSWNLLYDNHFTGWISSVTTHGSASFTIPATGRAGDHILEVLHGGFTFPYLNPEQTPEPDRPRWAIDFKVTPGAPVLPSSPEQQAQKNVRVLPQPGDLVSTPRFSGVGEPIKVNGGGLEPGRPYQLNWTREVGSRLSGQGWDEEAVPVAKATADASGHVEFSLKTPDDLGGVHGLWVQAGSTKKIGMHLIKSTALPLTVSRGPVGTKITIHLKGVGWTETSNIMNLVYDNSYEGYACAFNTQGDIQIFMPATGGPGWHFIDLYPGIYKGSQPEPVNYRVPQLTYANDHPGEDLPAFHFAFEVTPAGSVKQAQLQ